MDEQNAPAEVLPEAGPWAPPPGALPLEPELSVGAAQWTEVAPDRRRSVPVGTVIGGVSLAAAIAGLGVFNVWGLAGLVVAGAATAVGGPAAAVGVADFRRRLKTGVWRPAQPGRTGRSGRERGPLRRASAGPRLRSAGAGRVAKAATGGRGSKPGTLGRLLATTGRKTGKGAAAGGGRTPAARASKPARTSVPRPKPSRSGNPTRSRGLGRLLPAKRHAGRVLAAMGVSKPTPGWLQRQRDLRKLRHEHRLNRRRDLYNARDARRDARRANRRQWLVDRRSTLLRRLGASARVMATRPVPWLARRAGRALVGGWRGSAGARALLGFKARDIGWRARYLLWAPTPPAQLVPDLHDDDVDSDGHAVRRPARASRPVPAPVLTAPPVAPPVATPRPLMAMTKGSSTMHPAHEAVVDAYREAIGNWQPPDAEAHEEFEDFFRSWQEMFNEMGDITRGLADRFRDETPVETAPDYLEDMAASLSAMGDAGSEVYEAWRTGNAADHERAENPRPNEQMLNV